MYLNIQKIEKLNGTISAPPSKSFAHRYLIASALSDNESTISNVAFSDDIIATLNCLHVYGKKHFRDFENHKVTFSKDSIKNINPTFDCKESGTTLRLFMPIAMQKYEETNFIGSSRLIERGVKIYEDLFKYIRFYKDDYSIKTNGLLTSSRFELPGNVSSQYISGLLYALPLLDSDSEVIITTNLDSKNYVLMTLDVLKNYNINVETNIYTSDTNIYFKIPSNEKYIATDYSIEGDYSDAAFLDAFNYFGNDIKIEGLNPNSLQSDKVYKEYFDKLANDFFEIDISNCIDLGPILITFSALKNGARFTSTNRLKIKESDRGNAIATELRKCNADIKILDDEIIVSKTNLSKPAVSLNTHNDHRIAMSLSLLSTIFNITINDYECVNKSYPNYFDDLKNLGLSY